MKITETFSGFILNTEDFIIKIFRPLEYLNSGGGIIMIPF